MLPSSGVAKKPTYLFLFPKARRSENDCIAAYPGFSVGMVFNFVTRVPLLLSLQGVGRGETLETRLYGILQLLLTFALLCLVAIDNNNNRLKKLRHCFLLNTWGLPGYSTPFQAPIKVAWEQALIVGGTRKAVSERSDFARRLCSCRNEWEWAPRLPKWLIST